jgi:hypothetical protein
LINPNAILHQASQQDANSQYNGNSYYGYRQQGYEGYGYAAPNTQDPSMQNYYGYPGYGNYEQQQQQQSTQEQQQQPPPAQEQQQQQPPQQVGHRQSLLFKSYYPFIVGIRKSTVKNITILNQPTAGLLVIQCYVTSLLCWDVDKADE